MSGRLRTTGRWIAVLTIALAVAGAAVSPAAAAVDDGTPSFVVQLAEDGNARVTVTMTYDLESEEELAAFRSLQNDSEARADARARFRSRMAAVATDASDATGREMSVTDPAIDVAVSDGGQVGVVELSVTWTNMAERGEDGQLTVTEPFASGYTTDRAFAVRGPEGYRLADVTPQPADRESGAATWTADTDLSGFEVAFTPEDGNGGSGAGAPGFGAGLAVVAIGAAVALARLY